MCIRDRWAALPRTHGFPETLNVSANQSIPEIHLSAFILQSTLPRLLAERGQGRSIPHASSTDQASRNKGQRQNDITRTAYLWLHAFYILTAQPLRQFWLTNSYGLLCGVLLLFSLLLSLISFSFSFYRLYPFFSILIHSHPSFSYFFCTYRWQLLLFAT